MWVPAIILYTNVVPLSSKNMPWRYQDSAKIKELRFFEAFTLKLLAAIAFYFAISANHDQPAHLCAIQSVFLNFPFKLRMVLSKLIDGKVHFRNLSGYGCLSIHLLKKKWTLRKTLVWLGLDLCQFGLSCHGPPQIWAVISLSISGIFMSMYEISNKRYSIKKAFLPQQG